MQVRPHISTSLRRCAHWTGSPGVAKHREVRERPAHGCHYFVGVLLLSGWAIFVIATSRSLGTLGTVLSAAVIGTGIWLLADIGMVRAGSATAITWLALVALAILLAIGLSWAHIWRRLSGQIEVDEVND